MKIMKTSSKKKIGILTFHYSNNNFGAVIQAYSNYKLIECLGYEPYIIDFKPVNKIDFKGRILTIFQNVLGFKFHQFRRMKFSNFLKKGINYDVLKDLNNQLDLFTVGSDQVWRYRNDEESLKKYYLNFVDDDKPKIAIASSFGIDDWEGSENITSVLKKLVKRFHAISVREKSGSKICHHKFGCESDVLLDPTMIVNQSVIHDLANNSNLISNKKYLSYMLLDHSMEYEKYFKRIAINRKLKFVKIKGTRLIKRPDLWLYNSIGTWLDLLRKSEFVVTDSFHCIVFCLIFRRKFICLANQKRGVSRLLNILKMVGLESRFITFLDKDKITKSYNDEIDYELIWDILEKEKVKSINFLKSNFKDCLDD